MSHEPGIDGHGLLVLAWCSCGYNRTAATRATARRTLARHVREFTEMERRMDARIAALLPQHKPPEEHKPCT